MNDNFNQLTPQETERLAIMAEEMGEAQQIIGKILRHGYESHNPNDDSCETNRGLLQTELGHVRFAIQMLTDAQDLDAEVIEASADIKSNRINKYLHHQS